MCRFSTAFFYIFQAAGTTTVVQTTTRTTTTPLSSHFKMQGRVNKTTISVNNISLKSGSILKLSGFSQTNLKSVRGD